MARGQPPRLEWRSGEPRGSAGNEARKECRFHRLLAAACFGGIIVLPSGVYPMSNDNEFPAKQVNTDFRKETATVVLKFSDDHGAESVVTLPQSSLPMLLAALHDKLEQGPVTPI
jgi:hypothetical protein